MFSFHSSLLRIWGINVLVCHENNVPSKNTIVMVLITVFIFFMKNLIYLFGVEYDPFVSEKYFLHWHWEGLMKWSFCHIRHTAWLQLQKMLSVWSSVTFEQHQHLPPAPKTHEYTVSFIMQGRPWLTYSPEYRPAWHEGRYPCISLRLTCEVVFDLESEHTEFAYS